MVKAVQGCPCGKQVIFMIFVTHVRHCIPCISFLRVLFVSLLIATRLCNILLLSLVVSFSCPEPFSCEILRFNQHCS